MANAIFLNEAYEDVCLVPNEEHGANFTSQNHNSLHNGQKMTDASWLDKIQYLIASYKAKNFSPKEAVFDEERQIIIEEFIANAEVDDKTIESVENLHIDMDDNLHRSKNYLLSIRRAYREQCDRENFLNRLRALVGKLILRFIYTSKFLVSIAKFLFTSQKM